MPVKFTFKEIRKKILDSITYCEDTGCWEWNKGFSGNGYGSIFNGLSSVDAHKAAFEAFNNYTLPSKLSHTLVLHKCGNKKCVNPEHLYLGTKADNTCDALRDGAYKNRRAFSEKEVEKIRTLYSQGYSMRSIAKQVKSNHPRISRVINGGRYAQR